MCKFIFGFVWGLTTSAVCKHLYNKGRKDAINENNKIYAEKSVNNRNESSS